MTGYLETVIHLLFTYLAVSIILDTHTYTHTHTDTQVLIFGAFTERGD